MEDDLYRARLVDDEIENSWSIHLNFKAKAHSLAEDSFAGELLQLSDDWLDYCVAALKASPRLAFIGNAVVDQTIKRQLLPYLDSVSVSHEVNKEEDKKTTYSYIFHADDLSGVEHQFGEIFRLERAADSLARSQLSSIIAEFEFFLVRFAQIAAVKDPLKFVNGSESVALGELVKAKAIKDIISDRIEKKIRDEMRGSHDDIIKWIVDVMDLGDFSEVEKSVFYRDFMEACQRRHILAHNGGIVNELYHLKCRGHKIPQAELPAIGLKVSMTPSYIKRVTGRAFLLGLFLIHMKVQKLGEDERVASLESLLGASHDFLRAKQTKVCIRVLDFAENQKKSIPTKLKLSFGINRALAQLHDPKKNSNEQLKGAEEVLSRYDWSVTTPIFDLALACIRRQFDDILSLARVAYASGLDYVSASSFVVFSEARKIEGFMECFPRRPLMISHLGYTRSD